MSCLVLWSRVFLNELFFSDDNVQQMGNFFPQILTLVLIN